MPRTVIQDAERPGRTAESRINYLIDVGAPGIWDWNVLTGEFRVTPRLRAIFGFSHSDTISLNTIVDATHPADRALLEQLKGGMPKPNTDPLLVHVRILRGDTGEVRWIAARVWCIHESNGDQTETFAYSGTITDISDEVATATALLESEERLRLAIEAGKMAVWEVDLHAGTMAQSPELNILCGFEPGKILTLADVRGLYNPGEIERLATEGHTVEAVRERAVGGAYEPRHTSTLTSGGGRTQVQAEVAITTPAGVPKRLMLRAQYALSPEGRPRLTGLLVDITETKMAEERLATVARELQHRVKNSLSVIGAIAEQSIRNSPDSASALQAFRGRLGALSVANDLILAGNSSTADLHELIEKITRPYYSGASAPFVLKGEPVHLETSAVTALGMVLHELCTNAVKYGALGAQGGIVAISWASAASNELLLTWEERNGPPVSPPARRGFGTRLLQSVLSGERHGEVNLDFAPSGVVCRIKMRLAS